MRPPEPPQLAPAHDVELAACDAALARLPHLFRRTATTGAWHPLGDWLRQYRLQQRQAALTRAAAESSHA